MKAVIDSSALIHLGKIKRISLLKKLFEKIYIPKEVYDEVIIKGKEKDKKEIILIEELIKNNFIEIKESFAKDYLQDLDIGEAKAISICKELKIKNLIIDDTEGYETAEILGLNPLRTSSLLFILLDNKHIDLKEYENALLELSQSGYFMSAEIYQRLLSAGRNTRK